jgi:spore maturation protein A
MMSNIWLAMITVGVVAMICQHDHPAGDITSVIVSSSGDAVQLAIGLCGVLAFWSGIMRLAQEAGLTRVLGRWVASIAGRLFPDVPKDHPAMGAIVLSFAANILGLGNAATPLGIQAMRELQSINRTPKQASDAMCTFIAICASGLTIIPTTVIALRGVTGSKNPTAIVAGTFIATAFGTISAVVADYLLRRSAARRV